MATALEVPESPSFYGLADGGAYGISPDQFSDAVRASCRSTDQTYLPILVRLAILAGTNRITSAGDIYQAAVRTLLRSDDTAFDTAVCLCMTTFWKTGERTITFAMAPAPQKALLKDLIVAGLVVPATQSLTPGNPGSVRFFHDWYKAI